jgi:hypothetical protein
MKKVLFPACCLLCVVAATLTIYLAWQQRLKDQADGRSPRSYKVDACLDAAVLLQEAGKDKARDELFVLANDRNQGIQVFVLCRMLFAPKANGEFRRPKIGQAFFLGCTDYADWPFEPIEIVDGVPFLITTGYLIEGVAEEAEEYLRYCLGNCDWSTTRFGGDAFRAGRVRKQQASEYFAHLRHC